MITGTVTDEKSQPVDGVSIFVIGTGDGTMTNADGRYSLMVPPGSALQFMNMGYATKDVAVGNQTVINVSLTQELMDEVVVIGYGTQKKINLSGSVATVAAKTIKDRPITNLGQALQGSVANMNVSIASGSANTSPTYNIRGITSISQTVPPLIIIDGIVSEPDLLNKLNSTDIESISVLKDAASSAIYGSRAAFGVILVTTKTGKTEKLRVNYNNSFVWRTITKLPEVVTDPYLVAQTRNVMGAPWYTLYDEEKLAYAKNRSEDPSISPYYVNPNGEYTYLGNTNWVSEAYKNSSLSTNHSIDISGKTDKVTYFFSGSYFYQDGMIKYGTDKYNKYSLRSKLDFVTS